MNDAGTLFGQCVLRAVDGWDAGQVLFIVIVVQCCGVVLVGLLARA